MSTFLYNTICILRKNYNEFNSEKHMLHYLNWNLETVRNLSDFRRTIKMHFINWVNLYKIQELIFKVSLFCAILLFVIFYNGIIV